MRNIRDIITVAGRPGSGKSSASKATAIELGFEHFSSGDLMRELGNAQGLQIMDTNRQAEKDARFDRIVDGRLIELGKISTELVIDSRMAWHWIPDSLRVYLDLADLEVAAQRILKDISEERMAREHIPDNPEEYAEQLRLRLASEAERYKSKYGVNPYDTKNYDLVVDTAVHSLPQSTSLIVGEYVLWITQ